VEVDCAELKNPVKKCLNVNGVEDLDRIWPCCGKETLTWFLSPPSQLFDPFVFGKTAED